MYKYAIILFLSVSLVLHAKGRQDNESHEAADPSGFTGSVNIQEKKPGRWNIFLEARDKGGNKTIAGPHNIYIDPASDLPEARIINPQPNMHVQGNLNIVGACTDDDGVAYVEIVVTRGKANTNGEELLRARAEGSNFWSYYLDTTEKEKWPDGVYTVTAWGVDINGLSGISEDFPLKSRKQHSITWNLDRRRPETKVLSHDNGAIVTGKINLKGTVFDGNNIKNFSYSINEGETYNPVKIKYDKKNEIYYWDISIDTRKIKDGPTVIWFNALDGMNSLGVAAHLLFINNNGPQVEIVYPLENEPVNGIFTVAGYAEHTIGISSVSWKLGKESGEIPLVIGNPWWTKEFDIRNQKLSNVTLEIKAIDYSGNETLIKRNFTVDQKADLPVITLESPVDGMFIGNDGNLLVKGLAADNEGIASIFYSVDAQPAVEIPAATGIFQFIIPGLPAGPHTLDVWAKDQTDVIGPKVNIKRINGSDPSAARMAFDFASVNRILEIPDGKWVQKEVPLTIKSLDTVRSIDYSTDLGASWKSLQVNENETEKYFNISDMEDGTIQLLIKVTDAVGKQSIASFYVLKDTKAPQPKLILPIADAKVNGVINLGIAVEESGSLKKVTYRGPASESEDEEISAITKEFEPAGKFISVLLDSTMPLDENMVFIFEDKAGNISELNKWPFTIDREMDIPVVYISLPQENEVITDDFIVSGVMYDDDAVRQVFWRIDDGEEQIYTGENAYSIPISLSSLSDNEHTVYVYAEDVFGLKSEPVSRTFRISLSEPTAAVTLPGLDTIVKETVQIAGTAFDKNGIEKIQISLDNGNTYNDAKIIIGEFAAGVASDETTDEITNEAPETDISGTVQWTYEYNSIIFKDGTNVVFVRVFDNYGLSAVYSSLVNIDNTKPDITLDSPVDGAIITGPVYITGTVVDSNIDEINLELRSLNETSDIIIPDELRFIKLNTGSLFMEVIYLTTLPDGIYNLEIWATDKAKNVSHVSRNIEHVGESNKNFVDILYPMEGDHLQGTFNLYGITGGNDKAETVTVLVNGKEIDSVEVTDEGYFRFSMDDEILSEGTNQILAYSTFGGKERADSQTRSLSYKPSGPWVTIDSISMGDFAFDRPWVTGRAGYSLSEEDQAVLAEKNANKKIISEVLAKQLDYADISFDNGNTFIKTGKDRDKESDWRFRLETEDMTEGLHYIIVRAKMKNGETAITRTLVQVDKTPPRIKLISPQGNVRYNQELAFTALASDDVGLKNLNYHLRIGDKALYEVPGFVQGLYFETTIPAFFRHIFKADTPGFFSGGASYMDFGLGLSFFDDNVKIQLNYGFLTPALAKSMGQDNLRYGGNILGLKLLANVYTLPFRTILGPDWEWLSASFALGANFSLFDIGSGSSNQSGSATWMGALLAQIEFPKVTVPKRSYLRTFSLFTEGQLWFVPTDVNAKANNIDLVQPKIIMGLRMYIF